MKTILATEHLQAIDLGRIGYADALALQRAEHERVVAGRTARVPMTLFLLEHAPPVVTVTRRPGAAAHVLASDEVLARAGIERVETDRGGDVTYHGPGQLVAYPILDLERLGLKVHPYVRWLEQCLIDVLAGEGVTAMRDPAATGVWTGEEGRPLRKIAAIGVRLSRFASMHGFSLNVEPDLSHFGLIVPCGLERPVTSIARERGRAADLSRCRDRIAEWFARDVARLVGARLHSADASNPPSA